MAERTLETYAGASWLKKQMAYMKQKAILNQFHCDVADILGAAFRGIYHIEEEVMKTDWRYPEMVKINMSRELATWDGNELTILIAKCHEKGIRMAIRPLNFQYLRLIFHKRDKWDGTNGMMQHPGLERGIEIAGYTEAE